MTVVDGAVAVEAAPVGSGHRGVLGIDGPGLDLVLVAAVALPLVLIHPVAASVVALAAFGLLHTFLELRWVLARFTSVLNGRFLIAVASLATVIALARLFGAPRPVEIVAGFSLVALALTRGRMAAPATAIAGAALALGLAASLSAPHLYGIVLAHLHNVVTGVLLWEWSLDMAEAPRRRFRAVLVGLFAALPAFTLLGGLDALLPDSVSGLVVSTVSPGWATPTMTVRLMAVFALLQLVHYGVWCWLLPRRSKTTPPLTAKAGWAAVVLVAAGLLALVLATDHATGRTLYTSVATYHAYLEFPVVLILLGGFRVPAR